MQVLITLLVVLFAIMAVATAQYYYGGYGYPAYGGYGYSAGYAAYPAYGGYYYGK